MVWGCLGLRAYGLGPEVRGIGIFWVSKARLKGLVQGFAECCKVLTRFLVYNVSLASCEGPGRVLKN